ncbi:hypothetical protein Tco_1300901 [Tanacetum coccineum]
MFFARAYEDILYLVILNDKMLWWEVIWFPHNIPRHAFELWMASKVSLISPGKNSIWSIVRRLCIADTIIINSVRSKLLTLKVKDSSAVSEVEAKWGIQLIYLIEVVLRTAYILFAPLKVSKDVFFRTLQLGMYHKEGFQIVKGKCLGRAGHDERNREWCKMTLLGPLNALL